MAKRNDATLVETLVSVGFYKPRQGRRVRQATALAILLIVFFGCYTLSQGPLGDSPQLIRQGVPTLIFGLFTWLVYRLVNYPPFADFLIAVQSELDKVSWPSWAELYRSTLVVLATMFLLGVVLLGYDIFWSWLFEQIGFLRIKS